MVSYTHSIILFLGHHFIFSFTF